MKRHTSPEQFHVLSAASIAAADSHRIKPRPAVCLRCIWHVMVSHMVFQTVSFIRGKPNGVIPAVPALLLAV
jgi:hypothetical protein